MLWHLEGAPKEAGERMAPVAAGRAACTGGWPRSPPLSPGTGYNVCPAAPWSRLYPTPRSASTLRPGLAGGRPRPDLCRRYRRRPDTARVPLRRGCCIPPPLPHAQVCIAVSLTKPNTTTPPRKRHRTTQQTSPDHPVICHTRLLGLSTARQALLRQICVGHPVGVKIINNDAEHVVLVTIIIACKLPTLRFLEWY